MRLDSKTALGIDICETQIHVGLVEKSHNGFKLLKTASGPVPEGAVKDGQIADGAVLAKAIGKLKYSVSVRTVPAAVSLFAEPTISQIIEIPKEIPSNIGEFIRNQVKHFAALLGKKIALDFCGDSGVGSQVTHSGRVLATATDGQQVDELVSTCRRAGITVAAIEPPLHACIRALYSEKIEGRYDCNVLIAVLRDNSLTLCVFKRQAVDFVRTRQFKGENAGPEDLGKWLAGQVNMIMQSYDAESQHSGEAWEVTVVAQESQFPAEAQDVVIANVARSKLELITEKDISGATGIKQSRKLSKSKQSGQASLAAVGLAMKLLESKACHFGVNLLPAGTIKLRATQRRALVAANVIAVFLLLIFLGIIGSTWKVKQINASVSDNKARILQDTHGLVEKRKLIDEQVGTVSGKLKRIESILDSRRDAYWPGLLKDIAKLRPKTICITSLSSEEGSRMSIKGLAISNEDVYLFVDKLSESEHIVSASIVATKRDKANNGLVTYEVICSLVARNGA